MHRLYLGALSILAAIPALAEPIAPATSPAPSVVIAVTPELCQALAAPPTPEAAPEYRPGVDVHGKPVAPADLPTPAPALPEGVVALERMPAGASDRAALIAACRALRR